VVALRERRFPAALEAFPKDLERLSDQGDRLQLKLLWGNTLLRAGQARQARDLYFDLYREVRQHRNRPEWRAIGFKALLNAGLATNRLGETATAIQFYLAVLNGGGLRLPQEELHIRNLLGSLQTRQGELDAALPQLERALELALQCGESLQEADIRVNLAVLAHQAGRTADATDQLERSRQLAGTDPERQVRVEINMGTLLADLDRPDQAWVFFDKAQDLARRHQLQRYLPKILAKQACLRRAENLNVEARRLASEALELSQALELKDDWLQATCQEILQLPEERGGDDFELMEALITQHGIVAVSESMRAVLHDVQALAPSDLPVLILGETGTGKELVARALHEAGFRRSAPLVPVNCPAIPETLFESTLFGHVRGAFTGADQDRKGLVELAGEGSLFLDEIGDLPLSIQPKLLRFLESGEFQRMGSGHVHFSNARIIAATNRDLGELIAQRQFREDLVMRISAFRLELPPLRERREDVYFIASSLLEKLNRQHGQLKSFSTGAIQALNQYAFPGNVRELRNSVLRDFQIAQREIEARDLGLPQALHVPESAEAEAPHEAWLDHLLGRIKGDAALNLEDALQQLECRLIQQALELRQGDRDRTAEDLGLSARALKYKIAKYGIRSRKGRAFSEDDSQQDPGRTA
jgi:transcriptional regulator with GAF, ATPase, and Fis domain/exonuclease VII small subunit